MAEIIVQCDSREQCNSEILEYFEMVKQPYFISKVYSGDYVNFKSPKVTIDAKKDLVELCGNLTKDHTRFRNEILRAKNEMHCDMVVLIREPLNSLEDVKNWSSKRTKMSGKQLYKIMRTMAEKYGVIWRFCTRENAGAKIIQIIQWYENNR